MSTVQKAKLHLFKLTGRCKIHVALLHVFKLSRQVVPSCLPMCMEAWPLIPWHKGWGDNSVSWYFSYIAGGDVMYEMSRRKPNPTLLLTHLIGSLTSDTIWAWCEKDWRLMML